MNKIHCNAYAMPKKANTYLTSKLLATFFCTAVCRDSTQIKFAEYFVTPFTGG